MGSKCTICIHFSKIFPGEAPRTPTCRRGSPPPAPSPCGASRRFGYAPRQWTLWIRHCFDGSARESIYVYWSARKLKLGRWCWDLASCQLSLNSVQWFQRKIKMSKQMRDQMFLPIGPKSTNLVEDIEILLSVKFRWIPLSGFRGEVEKRPGRPSRFSDRPEKHKLDTGSWYLPSCQVSLNSILQSLRRSKSDTRAVILFSDRSEKTQIW